MEIQQLRHFVSVAHHGSIGRAAEALGLSQPGLSRSIRALEAVLGIDLFERRARGVAITLHGRQLLARAEVIVNEHDRAMAHARAASQLRSGEIRIGLHDVIHGMGGLSALGAFLDRNPNIGASIQLAAGAVLAEQVARAELDLAFSLFPLERRQADVHFEPLFDLNCRIYQRREAARSIAGARHLTDLLDHAWLLSGAMNFQTAFERALVAEDLPFPPQFLLSSSLALTLDILQTRDVLTILPEQLVAMSPLRDRLESCAVEPPGGRPVAGLLYRREALRNPAVEAAAQSFVQFARSIAPA